MSDDTIFLLSDSGELQRVPRAAYNNEDLLQRLIADHPELLAGEQIDSEDPIQWLVIRREAGIPDDKDSSSRWSVDHLLLDQHGRPTLVEVKRSNDTRIRREVVGQMLEYASNAQVYWPVDRIRTLTAEQFGGTEVADHAILDLLGVEPSSDDELPEIVEDYWKTVENNLRQGVIRLLFVGDELPRELRRIIEFLNEQMTSVEVLGIEIPQYVGGAVRALVPRLVGQTEAARSAKRKPAQPVRRTTREEFLASCPEGARSLFEDVINGATDRGLTIYWGTKGFSVRVPRKDGTLCSLLYGYPPGAHGRPTAFLDAYTAEIKDDAQRQAIRDKFLRTAQFEERGAYTLSLKLDAAGLSAAPPVLSALWEAADEVSGT